VTQELFSLAGKKALVTGASRGIGQVIAVAFAQAGADVALAARSADGLAETASQVRAAGRTAIEIQADLTTQDAANSTVETAIGKLGQLDIVVNNAGGSNFLVPFLDMRVSGWDKVLRLNLDATMWICQSAGAHMTARGRIRYQHRLGRGAGRRAVPRALWRR
jgi:NAD(P)-dependent dehydrogenase (short-subunit alcohol dehydrogenase family)